MTHSANPLKRRYQVFVSSTYEDLKDERQHVIQALLETKCIPLGMELFPAASVDQWKLIKRIIDECDYYIVIVAGRYGSIGNKGISYTEMEFDYACKINKPVIGFYHKSPKSLQGFKLEAMDAGRQKLEKFTTKVKALTCKAWTTSEGLGSAVKSAILYQLEFNPQPGWIKADTVDSASPSSKEPGEVKRPRSSRNSLLFKSVFPENDTISISVKGYGDDDPIYRWKPTWDQFILTLKEELLGETSLKSLAAITGLNAKAASKQIKKNDPLPWYGFSLVDVSQLEIVLKVLVAKKLVTMRPGMYRGSEYASWKFSSKGIQYLAELEASLHFAANEK